MKKPTSKGPTLVPDYLGENLSDKTPIEHLQDCLDKEGLNVPKNVISLLIEKGFIENRMVGTDPRGITVFYVSSATPLPLSKLPKGERAKLADVTTEQWPLGFKDLRAKGVKGGDISLQASPEVLGLVFDESINTDNLLGNDLIVLCKKHNTDRDQLARIIRQEADDTDLAWVYKYGELFVTEYTDLIQQHQESLVSKHTDIAINALNNLVAKISFLSQVGATGQRVGQSIA